MTGIYVPGTTETDPKKQNRSLQQIGLAAQTAKSDISTLQTTVAGLGPFATASVGQIPGTIGTTQPAAGFVGERISASTTVSVSTSGSNGNMGQIMITPGVWDIEASWITGGPGATTTTDMSMSIVNVTAGGTIGASPHYRLPSAADVSMTITTPRIRIAVSANTTLQQNFQPTFSGASYGASGVLQATRVS